MGSQLRTNSQHRHRPKAPLASKYNMLDDVTECCHTRCMTLSPRDRQIVRLADYFGQLSTGQLQALAFTDLKSRSSCDRTLKRLTETKYLAKVEKRRVVGGAHGGSGEYVWQLGPAGWEICKREGRWHRHAVDYHTLAIVDVYVRLTVAQRAGGLNLDGFTPEPECHVTVDGIELKPDLLVELSRPGSGAKLNAWLEIDLGTERQARLSEKMARYAKAYRSGRVDPFPRVVFVAHDAERAREIGWLISRLPADESVLFRSLDIASFPQGL